VLQIIVCGANIVAQTNASLVKGGGFCIAKDGGIIIKYNHNKSLISVEYIDLCVKQSLSQN
jgi:hypothetical protein